MKTRWKEERTESEIFHVPAPGTRDDEAPDSAPEQLPTVEPEVDLPTRPVGHKKGGRRRASPYPISVSSISLAADLEMLLRKFVRENRVVRSQYVANLIRADLKKRGYIPT